MLALCRALATNSRIIVADEATSNIDLAMDAKLQQTIRTEFAYATLLCIAHRLHTIGELYYDRVLLMDAGRVAEFDTPLNLFDKEDSIFRSLCNQAGLSSCASGRMCRERRPLLRTCLDTHDSDLVRRSLATPKVLRGLVRYYHCAIRGSTHFPQRSLLEGTLLICSLITSDEFLPSHC
ncbi:hypothetical protein FOMPIDRAFT_39674 [Fomitopsis schrenkii]|uniref:ABC transporter domain-containing protein n=1 Tax=Fomitopsis schrenkii TaxID=2126942 RepID=S8EP85_FOMSC|nr:hypothetical protein FOMPIDRAFT_39674 [Fomitopsis schrenkii]